MDEVRSYWQVASITHFCNLFGKPFKLPSFEPEELEQAFITDIPNYNEKIDGDGDDDYDQDKDSDIDHKEYQDDVTDTDYNAPGVATTNGRSSAIAAELDSNKTKSNNFHSPDQLHLLVKLAIPLLRPHFNCKIAPENWEKFLSRILDSNWVELEQFPSPLRVPILSSDGVELTKNLTFNELSLSDKIDIFSALCDYRLWCDDAADSLKDYTLEELRCESIGKDSKGYEYWYFSGTRLYRENKELVDEIILRNQRISKLTYKLVELGKSRIFREKEEKKKAELEKARREAAEAREQRLAIKKSEGIKRKRQLRTPPAVPLRSGLRERRSSAASNTNESKSNNLSARSASKLPNGKKQDESEQPKKDPEENARDELEKLKVSSEERKEAWQMQCESLEDWEEFVAKFEKTKSTNERYLYNYLNSEILPRIRNAYNKRVAEARRKEKEMLFALASRRVSSRIICKRAQEEEEERQAHLHEQEMRRKKVEAEARLKAELEREIRIRKSKFSIDEGTSSSCSINGEDSGRYSLRTQNISDEFEGIIHPDKLADFYEALELVIDTVRTCKHAWPFVEPVSRTVPNYYDLIANPMDLKKLRNKIEFREYRSFIEVEKDFQLIINNCEKFNGPTNIYTKMSYKLWKVFRKNVRLFLQRETSMNEYETFLYPPSKPIEEEVKEERKPSPVELEPEQTNGGGDEVFLPRDTSINEYETILYPPSSKQIEEEQEEVKEELKPSPVELEPQQANGGGEEVIIDSYDVPCPDDNWYMCMDY